MIFLNKMNVIITLLSILLVMKVGESAKVTTNKNNDKLRLRGIVSSPLSDLLPSVDDNDITVPNLRKQQRKLQGQPNRDDVEFVFDCHVPGMVGTMTNDRVIAYFHDSSGNIIETQEYPYGVTCSSNNHNSFEIQTTTPVEFVRLAIEGEGDALFIDRAWLKEGNHIVERWDINDHHGWCLSYESDDVVNMSWEENSHWDQCSYQICFKPNDVVEAGWGCEDVGPHELEQRFWFDCHIPHENNLGTNDMVLLSFYDSDEDIIDTQYVTDGIRCNQNTQNYFDVVSNRQIDSIMMMIITPSESGDEGDALFIDHAWLIVDGDQVNSWDGNGSMGYCLSTEADDVISGGWEDNSYWAECTSVICFGPNNDVVADACFI